jgi:hypothetical protein
VEVTSLNHPLPFPPLVLKCQKRGGGGGGGERYGPYWCSLDHRWILFSEIIEKKIDTYIYIFFVKNNIRLKLEEHHLESRH